MPTNYRIKDIFQHHKEDENGCWIWQGATGSEGYGLISRQGMRGKAHRFYYQHYVGAIPDGLHVLHKCDVRLCVNPAHLFLGTNLDNIADREAKGRNILPPMGEKHARAKLREAQVLEIRRRCAAGELRGHLAKEFGLHFSTVDALVKGKNWKNIPQPSEKEET